MFTSIHSKIVLFISLLLMGAVSASLLATFWFIDQSQQGVLASAFERTEAAVESYIRNESASLIAGARLVGILPIMRAVVEAGDKETILDNATTYQEDLKVPIFDVVDSQGKTLVRVFDKAEGADSEAQRDLVIAGTEGESLSSLAVREGRLALLASAPVGIPGAVAGALLIGRYLDDQFAKQIGGLTKTDISFLINGKIMGSSLPLEQRDRLRSEVLSFNDDGDRLVDVGSHFLKVKTLRNINNEPIAKMIVQFSMAEANALKAGIFKMMAVISLVILLFANALGYFVSRTISRPVATLKALTEQIIKSGDLSARAEVSGRDEVAALGKSFNTLLAEIQDSHRKLKDYSENLEKMVAERTVQLREAHANLEALLNNLGEGFMVIGRNKQILPGSSTAAQQFFGVDPTGRSLSEVLGSSGEDGKVIEDWVDLVFAGTLDFASLKEVGPAAVTARDGRYIELSYRPIYEYADSAEPLGIGKFICIAADKTQERALKNMMETERARVQMVLRVLKERQAFTQFVSGTRELLKSLILEMGKAPENIDVETVRRHLHTVKGGAASFYIKPIADRTHELEGDLERDLASMGIGRLAEQFERKFIELDQAFERFLRDNREIVGDVSQSLDVKKPVSVAGISRVLKIFADQKQAEGALYANFLTDIALDDFADLMGGYEETVREIGEGQGKSVTFRVGRPGPKVFSPPYQNLIATLIHIFRNAVDHGLETPEERRAAGKDGEGHIDVSFSRGEAGGIRLTIADDGRGVRPEIVLERAVAKGIISPDRASGMSRDEILDLLFAPGFSTRDTVSELSGRGVGLDAVRTAVQSLGGRVRVESKPGAGCCFTLDLPLIENPFLI